jgi:hypothetical protein
MVIRPTRDRRRSIHCGKWRWSQRAHLLNEKDAELAAVREALTERSLRIQELEHTRAKLAGADSSQFVSNRGQASVSPKPVVARPAT